MPTEDAFSQAAKPPRRNRWQLRILLAINALLAVLFVVSRLEPTQIKTLGPSGQYVYDLINPPAVPETSPSGQRLMADVKALGGQAHVMERSRRYLGLLGNTEQFFIGFTGAELDDKSLERFVAQYGDRIWGLDLRHTKVTDHGLRHLERLPQLEQLALGNDDLKQFPNLHRPISPITDAGLIHLKGLTRLRNLHLDGLPITDAGLDALKDLPALGGLYLSRTKIKGPGLAQLKSLPTLVCLYLDQSEINDEGLSFLTGASNLYVLSLNGVGLTGKGLNALKGLPQLMQLEVNGSGLLDVEVLDVSKSKPRLKIERR
jgi:hypothetical protein